MTKKKTVTQASKEVTKLLTHPERPLPPMEDKKPPAIPAVVTRAADNPPPKDFSHLTNPTVVPEPVFIAGTPPMQPLGPKEERIKQAIIEESKKLQRWQSRLTATAAEIERCTGTDRHSWIAGLSVRLQYYQGGVDALNGVEPK